jgi:hypothetical protein
MRGEDEGGGPPYIRDKFAFEASAAEKKSTSRKDVPAVGWQFDAGVLADD